MFYIQQMHSEKPECLPIAEVLFKGPKKSCITIKILDWNGNVMAISQPKIVNSESIFESKEAVDKFLLEKDLKWKEEQANFKKETGRTLKKRPHHPFRIGDVVFAHDDKGICYTILISDYTMAFVGGWCGKTQQYVEKIHWKRCIKIE